MNWTTPFLSLLDQANCRQVRPLGPHPTICNFIYFISEHSDVVHHVTPQVSCAFACASRVSFHTRDLELEHLLVILKSFE